MSNKGILVSWDIDFCFRKDCWYWLYSSLTSTATMSVIRDATIPPLGHSFFFLWLTDFFLRCQSNVGQNKNKISHFHDVGQIKLWTSIMSAKINFKLKFVKKKPYFKRLRSFVSFKVWNLVIRVCCCASACYYNPCLNGTHVLLSGYSILLYSIRDNSWIHSFRSWLQAHVTGL